MDLDSIRAVIVARSSYRSYQGRPLEPATRSSLETVIADAPCGPFGNRVRLQLLDSVTVGAEGEQKLGTYGVIHNAPHFLGGVVAEQEFALEDYGYVFEWAILRATALGLGTCWLGGTFRRERFGQVLAAGSEDVVPAVSPVGYPAERRGVVDRVFRFVARSKKRHPWSALFFDGAWGAALAEGAAGPYAEVLEMVRLGPSASNHQPWRILRAVDQARFLFFLERTVGYRVRFAVDLQRLDMGIAMCHFELCARELGLAGHWQVESAERVGERHRNGYLVSWIGEQARP